MRVISIFLLLLQACWAVRLGDDPEVADTESTNLEHKSDDLEDSNAEASANERREGDALEKKKAEESEKAEHTKEKEEKKKKAKKKTSKEHDKEEMIKKAGLEISNRLYKNLKERPENQKLLKKSKASATDENDGPDSLAQHGHPKEERSCGEDELPGMDTVCKAIFNWVKTGVQDKAKSMVEQFVHEDTVKEVLACLDPSSEACKNVLPPVVISLLWFVAELSLGSVLSLVPGFIKDKIFEKAAIAVKPITDKLLDLLVAQIPDSIMATLKDAAAKKDWLIKKFDEMKQSLIDAIGSTLDKINPCPDNR